MIVYLLTHILKAYKLAYSHSYTSIIGPLTHKHPNCVFWQHSEFRQLTTIGVSIFFAKIFTQHIFKE